ncbi:hypothetical protein EZM97_25135 [Dyella soli]|uniref:Uncharacterized protein n=1 Tax=Dyella soli TaxID=522319 RepID=A0A4R0YPL5_9GAMM|nr:hypothetical protein [Dyella soli]TCI07955.1 hypothetical protein EZM97_25135 [Dyella soli]
MLGLAHVQAANAARDPMCAPLKAFVASIAPKESKQVLFRTSWFGGFKDDPQTERSVMAKRCDDSGYAPGRTLCDALITYGVTEFAELNAMSAIHCLAPDMRFGRHTTLRRIDLEISSGTDSRGSFITLHFAPDEAIGGNVLTITAKGY